MDYFSYVDQQQLDLVVSKVTARREHASVFPPADRVFRALELTPLSTVKVVMVGQDPYHQAGQADGLAFSSDSIPKS
jgi:uracil-DNA glycosylase